MTRPTATQMAIAALRAGRPVAIGGAVPLTVLSVETASRAILDLLDPATTATLLLSGHRAAALGLANRRDAADRKRPVLISRPEWLDPEAARALADAGRDGDRAPLGPLEPVPIGDPAQALVALGLSRAAGLLPALWIVADDRSAVPLSPADFDQRPTVTLVARARLPLDDLPPIQIAAFRGSDDGQEHVALLVGSFGEKPPLVRVHSECLTGDVFGSLKCDCGPQLKQALRIIADAGGGILLYLRQEGRGIGLANKLRAYALQDRGLDTVEANLRLGFADDERDYAHGAAMLAALGVREVRLLTNNPAKVTGLEDHGIGVVERVGHAMPPNPHNAAYLAAKQAKSGHLP